MTNERRAKNCAKCKLRKSQEKFMNWIFDYRTCPFLCNQNRTLNGKDLLTGGRLY